MIDRFYGRKTPADPYVLWVIAVTLSFWAGVAILIIKLA